MQKLSKQYARNIRKIWIQYITHDIYMNLTVSCNIVVIVNDTV